MQDMTVDQVIGSYIKLRNKRDSIDAEAKQKTKLIGETMMKLEHHLMQLADAQGVDSFKTEHGTAFIKQSDYASVEDWDAVLGFIEGEKAYEFLTRKVNKLAVRDYIDTHEGVIPPGMSYGVRRDIQVRIPSKK
jgi:hypothetical protein